MIHKNIRYTLAAALLLCLPVASPQTAWARSETIAAVVNGDAVTASDIAARMKLIMTSSGMPDTEEVRRKVAPQIVNMLVEESLMMQEAGKQHVAVSDEEVQQGFAMLAQQNKFTPDQFRQILARGGIPADALNDQIRAQMAWTKVIQKKIRPQIEITDGQVDSYLKKLQANIGTPEYLVAEIYLPFENAKQEADVKQLADRLTGELLARKAPFGGVAAQFSQSASASKGGDMGWVQADQLPESVQTVLAGMKQGEMSRPIRSMTGYHILLLRNKRQITAETMPSRDDVRQRIGMQQLERMQRRYLLDLKSAAFIERRV